ncbi:MAG: glycosyl hydrolase [Schleiferiaceae bacterium]
MNFTWLKRLTALALFISFCLPQESFAQRKSKDDAPAWTDASLSAFKWRNVGPATTSGRIVDLAVDTENPGTLYLALASGGVWKTTNNGTTFEPIFDGEGSYSTGCVTIDPTNSNVVWVGSGENNNQRSVPYGDGVYVSRDGGKSWDNVGLSTSEHIGMITIDPNDGNHVYVAAYGPLWSAGGERGIYETKDGGKNWTRILHVSEHTGFNEIHMDPRDPKTLYATAHQRRRHVYTYLSGGPESAIYKSTDGGANWDKLSGGLPGGDVGRIGMDIAPANPDKLYATIEGHGTYASEDRGASWSKKSGHETSGNYYVEFICHPTNENTVYSMDTYAQVSTDGGKTFNRIPKRFKHVDNHCLWIDPANTDHMYIGTDGGLYETWDGMSSWNWKANIPTIQFYRVAVDNDWPFYNIYGGTQDNNSLGGPSQTINSRGIINSDWFVTNGGDGFESATDPDDPNIVYAQAQYGWLVRFNKQTGEKTPIQPQSRYKEPAYRWNWDAPLIASKHQKKTLYFAANKVFKSTDRGDSWTAISGDLSRQLDRNTLPIMDRYWGPEAVALHKSTSIYGNIVTMKEHPNKPGHLWVGTDDGLVWKTEDDGKNWTSVKNFNTLPKTQVGSLNLPLVYVQDIVPSQHDDNVIYAAINNHKNGDFKPYLFKSDDGGRSWESIASDLPERGSVYSVAEDHINPNLLFVGTEFGLWFTLDGGEHWKELGSGLPTIAVRDIAIQERENDLVLATFGRGFYVLDNYSPLRELEYVLNQENAFFTTKPGLLFRRANIGGVDYKGAQFYTAKNPKVGVTFEWNTSSSAAKVKDNRPEANENLPHYPSLDQLREEDWEEKAYLLFEVTDSSGNAVARFTKNDSKGIQRYTWDGRISSTSSIRTNGEPVTEAYGTSFVMPGTYYISMHRSTNGSLETLVDKHEFKVNHLYNYEGIDMAFNHSVDALNGRMNKVMAEFNDLNEELGQLRAGLRNTPGASMEDLSTARSLDVQLKEVGVLLKGDATRSKREFETAPSAQDAVGLLAWGAFNHRGAPTGTMKQLKEDAEAMLADAEKALAEIDEAMDALEAKAVEQGVPFWD